MTRHRPAGSVAGPRRLALAVAITVAMLGALLPLGDPPAAALIIRPFTPRFSTNVNGDITLIGNTNMTCPTSNRDCIPARERTIARNNNAFAMEYVDVDGDP